MDYQEILNILFIILLAVACIAGLVLVLIFGITGLSSGTFRVALVAGVTGVSAWLLARRNIRRAHSDEG